MSETTSSEETSKTDIILIITQRASVSEPLVSLLSGMAVEVAVVDPVNEKESLEEAFFDVIIIDAEMLATLAEKNTLRSMQANELAQFVLLVEEGDEAGDEHGFADQYGLEDFNYTATMPWEDDQLLELVKNCLSIVAMQKRNTHIQGLLQKQNDELKSVNKTLEKMLQQKTESLNRANANLKKSYEQLVTLITSLLDRQKDHLKATTLDIDQLILTMSNALGFTEREKVDLFYAARLRYLGLLGLPHSLINTPYIEMTDEQQATFQQHPIIGSKLLEDIPPLQKAGKMIANQKEYLNGKGFPNKRWQRELSKQERTLTMVNDFLELVSGRQHHEQFTVEEAVNVIRGFAGDFYDAEIFEVFEKIIEEMDISSIEKESRLLTAQLHSGMELARDLFSENGSVLITKGTELNNEMIEKVAELEKEREESFTFFIDPKSIQEAETDEGEDGTESSKGEEETAS